MLLPLYFTILALSFTIIFLLKWFPLSGKKTTKPPSPFGLPIIGNLHKIGLFPHRSLQSLAQIHGPIMLLQFGSNPVLVISSAEIAQEIMKTHDIIFANRPNSRIGNKLLYEKKDVALAPYGEYWRQMKSVCVLHLLSNKRVQSFRNVREEETAGMIESIEKSYSSSLPALNLSEVFAKLTNDMVCRVALGKKYSAERSFKELFDDFARFLGVVDIGDYIPWLGWVNRVNGLYGKVEKVADELDNFLDRVVAEHLQQNSEDNNKDFVDVLLWIQKENLAGFPIDATSVKALILDVFAAGTDTTYTVLEWAMTELLRHPEIMKKLQNELRSEITSKDSSTMIAEKDLNKLQYLKAVIKETLRFHPPIPLLVPRLSTHDIRIKGFDIAAGTQVIINAWAIGRDPGLWDRAEEFWPERFLNSSIDFKGHDFQLIPFGAGRRICPGIQFAMSTIELALANLLYKFDWSLNGVAKGEDMDVTECTGLTIHRKFPLFAVATPYSG